MVTQESLESLFRAVENMTLSEWELISNMISNSFKSKALDYQRQLKFKDLPKENVEQRIKSIFLSDDLDK